VNVPESSSHPFASIHKLNRTLRRGVVVKLNETVKQAVSVATTFDFDSDDVAKPTKGIGEIDFSTEETQVSNKH
jgi:hypothetical protein